MAIDIISADRLQLIVPNLHPRYSGITATNRMVAPKLARMFQAAWFGPDAPDAIGQMGVIDLLKLWRRRSPLIWHARRNNEMIAGVVLRWLGWPLKLVFTSAAQRHHTPYAFVAAVVHVVAPWRGQQRIHLLAQRLQRNPGIKPRKQGRAGTGVFMRAGQGGPPGRCDLPLGRWHHDVWRLGAPNEGFAFAWGDRLGSFRLNK